MKTYLLDNIIKQECAKRAIEIALCGNHSIKFLGNEEAQELKLACAQLKINAFALPSCRCGNLKDRELPCICRPFELKKYQSSKKYRAPADLIVEIYRLPVSALQNYAAGKIEPGETTEKMLARVEKAKLIEVKKEIKNSVALNLLKNAINHLSLNKTQIDIIIKVAATIAKLDACLEIQPAHIAEALQYRAQTN